MRDDRARLEDMIEAIDRIERRAGGGRSAFEADDLLQVWVVHHLQIIGEAARALSNAFRDANARVPWAEIIGMRHVLVHNYFAIDRNAVWATVERDLPSFKRELKRLIEQLPDNQSPLKP